jgi:3-hydroxyisobutyrate dehydrogenase
LVNNHLAGVHIAAAAEGFAFAKKKNMNLQTVLDVLVNGAAYTYVLKDREWLLFLSDR